MNKGLILMFHSVQDPQWFERTLLFLTSRYDFVGMGYFGPEKKHANKKIRCHITFDDGDLTFYRVAFPVLKKLNVPATLFVSPQIVKSGTNFWFQEVEEYDQKILFRILARVLQVSESVINGMNRIALMKCLPVKAIEQVIAAYRTETGTTPNPSLNMNLDQLLEVDRSGLIAIGAHTLNHPVLSNETEVLSYLEITESISRLENMLGHPVVYFAYPNGIPGLDFGNREMDCLAKKNIAIAVSTESRYVNMSDNKLSLPRISISHGSIPYLKLKLALPEYWETFQSLRHPTEKQIRKKIFSAQNKFS